MRLHTSLGAAPAINVVGLPYWPSSLLDIQPKSPTFETVLGSLAIVGVACTRVDPFGGVTSRFSRFPPAGPNYGDDGSLSRRTSNGSKWECASSPTKLLPA